MAKSKNRILKNQEFTGSGLWQRLSVLQALPHHPSLGAREHAHCTLSASAFYCLALRCLTGSSPRSLLLNIGRTLLAARALAWLRANAAALGVGTPFVGVVFFYAWNATETRKIRNGYFSPKAPADYQNRFCLFPWHMMETAKMVGLVGLKSTGKSSTLCYFLRERPNPF